MKAHIKSICLSMLTAFAIVPLWMLAFPECTALDLFTLIASVVLAVNGYLWATEEGK